MKRIISATLLLAVAAFGVNAQQIDASRQLKGIVPTANLPSTTVYRIASGSTAMGTSAIASGACATAVTVSAAGVLTTDVLTASFNSNPTGVTGYIPSTAGILTIIPYPTAGNVNFLVCNMTASSITPGAITVNWRVDR